MRQRGDHGVKQTDVDMLALAAIDLAVIERGEDADRGVHAGHVVDDGRTDLHRALARLAVDMASDAHQAAHRLQDRVIAGAARIRPGLPKAGHRAIDDARVDRLDRIVVQPVALEITDLVVLHHHVAVFRQFANDGLALGLGNIDGDGFFAAVGAQIERIVVVRLAFWIDQIRRPERARIVAGAGPFDLDDFGAEIGQHLRRQGPRENPRQIENPDARKRLGRHGCFLRKILIVWRGSPRRATPSRYTIFCRRALRYGHEGVPLAAFAAADASQDRPGTARVSTGSRIAARHDLVPKFREALRLRSFGGVDSSGSVDLTTNDAPFIQSATLEIFSYFS